MVESRNLDRATLDAVQNRRAAPEFLSVVAIAAEARFF
jgi:hypothetical protein